MSAWNKSYRLSSPPTAREAIAHAVSLLGEVPVLRATASLDAALLLLHTLGISRAELLAAPDRLLTDDQYELYEGLITRRLTCEPIQYITGEQEFYGLALRVTPSVLIPRPETEHLVESVLAELDAKRPQRLADIGTGSGAIAIALAHQLPLVEVVATDISPAALELAAENAARHGLSDRIRFVESDLLAWTMPGPESEAHMHVEPPFDAIVSNPPYIAIGDGVQLHPQVRNFEPATALFATGNGLDVYRRLIPQAFTSLRPGGLLALEIGEGQQAAVNELLCDWNAVRFVPDLQQIPRVALARRR